MRRLLLPLLLASLAACTLSLPGKGPQEPAPAAIVAGAVAVTTLAPSPLAPPPLADPATADATATAQPRTRPAPRPATAPAAPPTAPAAAPAKDLSTAAGTPPPTPAAATTPEERACLKTGGTWATRGAAGLRACILPTRDGGKSCRKESDCEGLCLSRSRTCAPVKPLFGCVPILQQDGSEATICID